MNENKISDREERRRNGMSTSPPGSDCQDFATFPNGLRCDLQNSDGMHSCPRVIFRSLWFLSFGCFFAANFARDLGGGLINKGSSRSLTVSSKTPSVWLEQGQRVFGLWVLAVSRFVTSMGQLLKKKKIRRPEGLL